MQNIIITINRECGSGGGEIARRCQLHARNYDATLNVTGIEPDAVASFLAEQIRNRK